MILFEMGYALGTTINVVHIDTYTIATFNGRIGYT